MSINLRIVEFAEKIGTTIRGIEREIGTRHTIRSAIDNNSSLGVKWIVKIMEAYPNLNIVWLMTGQGPILKTELDKEHMIREAQLDKKVRQIIQEEMKPMLDELKRLLLMNHTESERQLGKIIDQQSKNISKSLDKESRGA